MCYTRVTNWESYDPFHYLKLYPGDKLHMESSLVAMEGPDRASVLSSKVNSLVGFQLGSLGYDMGSMEGISMRVFGGPFGGLDGGSP